MTNILLYEGATDLQDLLAKTPIENMPQVILWYDEKSIGIVEDQRELVLIKPDTETIQYWLHGDDTFHTAHYTVQIWTFQGLDRLNDLVNAIFNYAKTNVRFSINGRNYCDLLVIGSTPLSQDYRQRWGHNFDFQLRLEDP